MSTAAPREAATVILVREASPFEILMIARNPARRVMGGVWAFPGGGVEPADGADEGRLARAAIRELAEETAITGLRPSDLVHFSRWIAPVSLPVRFDTHFFLARAPHGQEPEIDRTECVDSAWLGAAEALARHAARSLPLLFPTRRQLERLAGFASLEALLTERRGDTYQAVRPRLGDPGNPATVLLPGDPGYETATG